MDWDFSFDHLLHSRQEFLEGQEEIEELQGQHHVDSGDETMAVQIHSPSRNPSRRVRNEQLASASNFEFQPCLTPSPNPRPEYESLSKSFTQPEFQSLNFYCEVCKVPCSGSLNYKNHFDGKYHKLKLQELLIAVKDGRDDCKQPENTEYWCKICNIWCVDDNCLKQHLEGKKHKRILERLGTVEGGRGEELSCDLCCIGCSSKELLQLHFNGKKHQAEVRKLQQAENRDAGRPKRYKLGSTTCIDKSFADSSQGGRRKETFLERVESKKRQWQDLIRDIGANN